MGSRQMVQEQTMTGTYDTLCLSHRTIVDIVLTLLAMRNHIYTSHVRPVLEYGIVVRDPYQQFRIMEAVQNRAPRYVHQDWQWALSVTAMNGALCWLLRQNRRLVIRLTFVHDTMYGQHPYTLPPYVNKTIRYNKTYHEYTYTFIRAQTDAYLYSYLHTTMKAWSSLPGKMSNTTDIDRFREKLVSVLIHGNDHVVHISITTNQARDGTGANKWFI